MRAGSDGHGAFIEQLRTRNLACSALPSACRPPRWRAGSSRARRAVFSPLGAAAVLAREVTA
jgi:hypothetical protein